MTLDTLQNGDPITPEWIDQLILKLTECADLAATHAQSDINFHVEKVS